MDELPDRLIVGCGMHGRLQPHPSVLEALRERGVEAEAADLEAVKRYGEPIRREPRRPCTSLCQPLFVLGGELQVRRAQAGVAGGRGG